MSTRPTATTSSKSLRIPAGWTDDKIYLAGCNFTEMEFSIGLGKAILYSSALSTFLIECKGKPLLYNEDSGGVDEIKGPTEVDEIFCALPDASNYKKPDWSKMKTAGLDATWS